MVEESPSSAAGAVLHPGVLCIESDYLNRRSSDGAKLDNLADACNLLYDAMDWVPNGTTITKRIRHKCDDMCDFVNADRLYICIVTCNVHICTYAMCNEMIHASDLRVCRLTGNTFEFDDRVIYGYDNASRNGDDIDINNDSQQRQMEADTAEQYGVPLADDSAPSTTQTVFKRRKSSQVSRVPVVAIAVSVSIGVALSPVPIVAVSVPQIVQYDWATVAAPARKKAKHTKTEIADRDRYEVSSLAIMFLTELKMPSGVKMNSIADSCARTWTYIQDTELLQANINKYRPRYHVAVLLRCIQLSGLVYGGREFAPHMPELGTYLSNPKVFIADPFCVPSGKFTSCSTLLRKCLSEKIMRAQAERKISDDMIEKAESAAKKKRDAIVVTPSNNPRCQIRIQNRVRQVLPSETAEVHHTAAR